DGSVCLNLGEGDTIFDLIAHGANDEQVTVHLGYYEARNLLADASAARIAFGTGTANDATATTMGGVTNAAQPEGELAIAMPARSDRSPLAVSDGGTPGTTLTLTATANDSLILGLATILSQL